MAINYARLFHRRATPQSEPIPGSAQVPNSAGGYAWQIDDWTRLDRFLILGAEGGTYYIGERDLVKENHDALVRCIQTDGGRAVNRIVEISDSGRAPKNDPALFALALVAAHGDPAAKALAFQSLGKVCRIGTHLFHFAEYVNALRGWGRGLRGAVGRWYVDREADDLALQVVKYQQRDSWSHGDLLRLAHPKAPSRDHEAVFRWILAGADGLGERTVTRRVKGEPRVANYAAAGELPALIVAFEQAKKASSKAEIVKLITEHDLPREAVPTQWLNEPEVWDVLLQRMPMTAMIRNLGKMTSLGLLQPFSDAAKLVVNKLSDEKVLKRARIHPLALLIAEKVYAQGHGEKGDLKWQPVAKIVDALDAAFYATFSNVEPCGKPVLLALDVSGSMDGSRIAGSCLTAREASAAMALVTAATEPDCEIIAFSAPAGGGYGGMHGGGESGITRVTLSPRMRLDDVIKRISAIPMGGTDCALPMIWARRQKLNVSGFITYTDSETWAGNIHPAQALRLYRGEYVSEAKAVVVGMTANGFTLADPNDRGMLDVVGFDATVPAVIADFVRS
ncbi:MAG TPA: TROVE domain-containing protein [Verrucomicrobiota bacterium]|nr:TROVE domain-containing protein [Verrucomicrobiota bacterium]HNU50903.1 TROVE domain-containing protein [Verrucomicrobiota bacterium]